MLDILTYAIAKKKATENLGDLAERAENAATISKQGASSSQASAAEAKDLLAKTEAAAQQAAASSAAATYALGPDPSGKLSFFVKETT